MALKGLEGSEAFWHAWQDAFPDNRVTLRAAFGTDDAGVEEGVFAGTHTEVLRSADGTELPPQGRSVSVPYVMVYGFRAGRVLSVHVYFDQVELLAQLGVLPAPA